MSTRKSAAVHLTDRAIRDLQEVESYSAGVWGKRVAAKYMEELAAAFDRLADRPALLRLEPEFSSGLYFYRVGKHVLVCDAFDANVVVLTVLSTSMDLSTRLNELEPRLAAESKMLRTGLRKRR